MTKTRIRLRFKKFSDKKFISHLDFMRLFERALRRAQIPVSMTMGFNPRPKLSFPLALQLGIEGLNETLELELEEWTKPSDFYNKLSGQLPDGISISQPELIPLNAKSKITGAVYNVTLNNIEPPDDNKIRELLNSNEVFVKRTKKRIEKKLDIRPSINGIERSENGLILHIKVLNEGTAKPKEILDKLDIDTGKHPEFIKIVRTNVQIQEECEQG